MHIIISLSPLDQVCMTYDHDDKSNHSLLTIYSNLSFQPVLLRSCVDMMYGCAVFVLSLCCWHLLWKQGKVETDRQIDRVTDRVTDRDRETETERERERGTEQSLVLLMMTGPRWQ